MATRLAPMRRSASAIMNSGITVLNSAIAMANS